MLAILLQHWDIFLILLVLAGFTIWRFGLGLYAGYQLFVDAGRWVYSQPFWITAVYAVVISASLALYVYIDAWEWGTLRRERTWTIMAFLILPFLAVGGVIAWAEQRWRRRRDGQAVRKTDP